MSTATALPLNRERILACALAIADRDGLDGASLRKVATELGVHVTSLYNHVPTKDALLEGVVEELFASVDLPVGDHAWDEWVRRFVDAVAEMARRHPGAFAVLLRRPVEGPRANATFEAGLAAFARTGMTPTECYAAVKSVALGVLGCCIEQAYASGSAEVATDLARLSPEDFPMLHAVSAVAEEVDVVTSLREVLVSGLAGQLPKLG